LDCSFEELLINIGSDADIRTLNFKMFFQLA